MVRLILDTDFEFKKNFVLAIFYTLVAMVLEALIATFRPTLLSVLPSTYQSGIVYIIAFFVVFTVFTILNMKRTSVAGLTVYLFFPKDWVGKKTLDEHEPYQHRVIVNTKKVPTVAYPLIPGSYAWGLVKKHLELVYALDDEAPSDSDHDRKWCKKRNYEYEPKSPSREDLLDVASIGEGRTLDPRLDHIQARFFYFPLLYRRNTPKRCLLNYATKKAFTYDSVTRYKLEGRIRSGSGPWWPRPHYVQRWAKKQGFEWSDKVPTPEDLLAKDNS